VEGAGGLMSPLSDEVYNIDLARDLGFPLVIVAANELGVINATLQTLITARAKAPELPVAGIVLNQPARRDGDESLASNAQELAARCEAPLLATVAYGAGRFDAPIDWFAVGQQSTMHAKDLTTEHTKTTEKRIDD
jgi:dethiobiotin synthetase